MVKLFYKNAGEIGMAEIDLKIYTTRVKELEAAIYTQKNLMSSYLQIIKEQNQL